MYLHTDCWITKTNKLQAFCYSIAFSLMETPMYMYNIYLMNNEWVMAHVPMLPFYCKLIFTFLLTNKNKVTPKHDMSRNAGKKRAQSVSLPNQLLIIGSIRTLNIYDFDRKIKKKNGGYTSHASKCNCN